MGHYENSKKALQMIEMIVKESKKVKVSFLVVTTMRCFGFGRTFVMRQIESLESCGIVKLKQENDGEHVIYNEPKRKDLRASEKS